MLASNISRVDGSTTTTTQSCGTRGDICGTRGDLVEWGGGPTHYVDTPNSSWVEVGLCQFIKEIHITFINI